MLTAYAITDQGPEARPLESGDIVWIDLYEPTSEEERSAEAYLGSAKIRGLPPGQATLVAAHNNDLDAAQNCGLNTAFVARPTEYGPHQNRDFKAEGNWDYVAKDFNDLADKLGC